MKSKQTIAKILLDKYYKEYPWETPVKSSDGTYFIEDHYASSYLSGPLEWNPISILKSYFDDMTHSGYECKYFNLDSHKTLFRFEEMSIVQSLIRTSIPIKKPIPKLSTIFTEVNKINQELKIIFNELKKIEAVAKSIIGARKYNKLEKICKANLSNKDPLKVVCLPLKTPAEDHNIQIFFCMINNENKFEKTDQITLDINRFIIFSSFINLSYKEKEFDIHETLDLNTQTIEYLSLNHNVITPIINNIIDLQNRLLNLECIYQFYLEAHYFNLVIRERIASNFNRYDTEGMLDLLLPQVKFKKRDIAQGTDIETYLQQHSFPDSNYIKVVEVPSPYIE